MRTPSLRQIEAFMAFIEAGTVGGAAELLRISQPAASKLLIHLEDDTGLTLFERDSGRLVVTDRGMRLYQEIDRIFSGVHQVERAVEAIRREDRGQLHVGIMPGLSGPFIRRAMTGFLARHPNVYVSIHARSSQIVADWLVRRQLDVGIISSRIEHPGLTTEPLIRRPLVCLLPPGHRLAEKEVVTPTDLAEEPFIAFTPESHTRVRVDEAFKSYGVKPNIVIDATTAPNVCEFVAAGLGVTLVHPLLADSVRGRVLSRQFQPLTPFDFLLCRPRDARNRALIDAFIEETRKAASETALELSSA